MELPKKKDGNFEKSVTFFPIVISYLNGVEKTILSGKLVIGWFVNPESSGKLAGIKELKIWIKFNDERNIEKQYNKLLREQSIYFSEDDVKRLKDFLSEVNKDVIQKEKG
jgi:hypothetical protein